MSNIFQIVFAILACYSYFKIEIVNAQECMAQNLSKRVLCYYATWAQWRPAPGNIKVSDLDPCLCTHIVYSFVKISQNKLQLGFEETKGFSEMIKLKEKNPNLKLLISVGGWNEGSSNFISIISKNETMNSFCSNVISVLREHKFDGFDIDWEFPTSAHKNGYTEWVKTCYNLFQAEAEKKKLPKLILSAATAPDDRMYALDLAKLNQYFDFISPMTYDLHGSWDGNKLHHSPLHGPDGSSTTLEKYIKAGVAREKLNLGFATYGRGKASTIGNYTREGGILAYYEVCKMKSNNTEEVYDEKLKVPNIMINSDKVFYDNPKSISDKTEWALANDIGGVFTWDASMDDFNDEFCSQGKYPLLSAATNLVYSKSNPKIQTSTSQSNSASTTISKTSQGSSTTTRSNTITTISKTSQGSSTTTRSNTITTRSVPITTTRLTTTTTTITSQRPSTTTRSAPITTTRLTTTVSTRTTTRPVTTTRSITTARLRTNTTTLATATSDCINGSKPHPKLCEKYIACDDSNTVMICPDGLHFNPKTSACDWPENAKCVPK